MKTLKTLVCALLCLTSAVAFSQKKEPVSQALFSKYPDNIRLSKNTLQNTFTAKPGNEISVAFTPDFVFTGVVMSNLKKYENLQSVIIRSAAYDNAIFQLSMVTNDDKSISYVGRIINPASSDGYEIVKEVNDSYSFRKFETKKILQDCSFK